MLRSKLTIKMKTTFLLFTLFGIIFTNLNLVFFISNIQENQINTDNKNVGRYIGEIGEHSLKTSEYLDFNGVGEQLNITLHQSLINTSTIEFTNLDTSNRFTEPFPNFNGYNTSFINVSFNAIYAPNKTIELETGVSNVQDLTFYEYAFSFEVLSSCILEDFALCFSESGSTSNPATIDIHLYNATYDSVEDEMKPLDDMKTLYTGYSIPDGTTQTWFNFTGVNEFLDISNTNNKTFFIWIRQTSGLGTTSADFHYENDGLDNSAVWRSAGTWALRPIDASFVVNLSLSDNNAKPSDIGLKVNNTIVQDLSQGTGYWENNSQLDSSTDKLDFDVSADWWDVSCNVTNVQINYTKTDLKATSNFDIPSSGQEVQWNSTVIGGLNYFDFRIADFNTINFTIPETWQDTTIKVFNDTTEETDLIKRILGNGYRDVQVLNAGNGSNWYLTANSTNLISSINTFVSGIPITQVNFTNNLRFNTTFSEIVSNGNLNLSVYSPNLRYLNHSNIIDISLISPSNEFIASDWDISDNATDYGIFKAQVSWNNDTAAGFLEFYFTIVADTNLILVGPPSGEDHYDNELFDVIIFYNDTGPNSGNIGIPSADITEDSGLLGAPTTNGTDGYYFLQLDTDIFSYGWNYIEINASKSFYNNQSVIFSFHYRRNTTISPSNTKDFGDVIRGNSASYTFNYSDNSGSPVLLATIDSITLPIGFTYNDNEEGNGNYTIELVTTTVQASATPYTCIFNITLTGYETQELYLNITIIQAQTSVTILTPSNTVLRKDGFDQTLEFFFNDTETDTGIIGIALSDINVRDNQTGLLRSINTLTTNGTAGYYKVNVSILGLNSGWIQFTLNVSRDPDYNWSLDYFTFYLRGNLTQTALESLSDPGGEGMLTLDGYNYSSFVARNIYVNFTITDDDYDDNLVTGDANSYIIDYFEIGNPTNQGTLAHSLDFDLNTDSYKGYLISSGLTASRTYGINITIIKTNYENSLLSFNLTIKPKINISISVVNKPTEVNAGDSFNVTLKALFYNGTAWEPLNGVNMIMIPNFNGVNATPSAPRLTDFNGTVTFEIIIGTEAISMVLTAEIASAYNHTGATKQISDITVIPYRSGLEQLMPYLILGGIIIAAVAGSVAIYRGVVVPKKREKQRILSEVKTIFDDAINLEHILVLYKGTGTCIFFKSYGSEQIDPELIGGFLTAVSSFGKEMVAQESLNEISYGDKMLLLADGVYIRVALVLGKKASLILRKHLKEFIDTFEKTYKEVLPSWRGQLAHFRNAGEIVDDILNTSIILPHQISYDFSTTKDLKSPHSKDLLKISHACCEEADRQFFFIATLLQQAVETTNKDTAEIFMGIKELRDKRILIPIEISAIEAQPISQQELNLISQKVSQMTNLSPEERQKLVSDLSQMGPMQREAYLSSIAAQQQIVSAPVKSTIGPSVIENKKSAKSGIRELIKRAKTAKAKKNTEKTVELLQNAALIASNWNLSNEFIQLEEYIRKIKIEDMTLKKNDLEKEAKLAVKKKDYNGAATKYKEASKMASEIFKLGATRMTKEVKRLTNKANEYGRLI